MPEAFSRLVHVHVRNKWDNCSGRFLNINMWPTRRFGSCDVHVKGEVQVK